MVWFVCKQDYIQSHPNFLQKFYQMFASWLAATDYWLHFQRDQTLTSFIWWLLHWRHEVPKGYTVWWYLPWCHSFIILIVAQCSCILLGVYLETPYVTFGVLPYYTLGHNYEKTKTCYSKILIYYMKSSLGVGLKEPTYARLLNLGINLYQSPTHQSSLYTIEIYNFDQ